jgi:hypothetical protein
MGAGPRVRCKKCENIIQSKYRHNFVECKCGQIFVDGGDDYFRLGTPSGGDVNLYAEILDKVPSIASRAPSDTAEIREIDNSETRETDNFEEEKMRLLSKIINSKEDYFNYIGHIDFLINVHLADRARRMINNMDIVQKVDFILRNYGVEKGKKFIEDLI